MSEPKLTLRSLFVRLSELEPKIAKSLLDEVQPWKDADQTAREIESVRARLLNKVCVLGTMKTVGLEKLKSKLEDVFQVIAT